MTYDFSFDRKSIGAMLACSVVLLALLFFAGVLVGAGWNAKADAQRAAQPAAQTDAQVASARTAVAQPVAAEPAAATGVAPRASSAVLPQEPVLYDDPARREYAAQGYGPQRYDAQPYDPRGYGAQPYEAPAQTQQPYAARASAAPANAQASNASSYTNAPAFDGRREAERLRSRGVDADPRVVAEADDAPERATASRAAAQGYAVQVGTYLDEAEARRIATELENKGYTPTVFSGRDAEARVWYAVRIGAYANAQDASQAANNFARQEKRKALVRPAGSL